jgi:hypothetical protein
MMSNAGKSWKQAGAAPGSALTSVSTAGATYDAAAVRAVLGFQMEEWQAAVDNVRNMEQQVLAALNRVVKATLKLPTADMMAIANTVSAQADAMQARGHANWVRLQEAVARLPAR